MVAAAVVWLIRYGAPRARGGRFRAVAAAIADARAYLMPPLQAIIDAAAGADPERAPIEVILAFMVERALPTLLIAILIADRARSDAKVAEYVLSVAEIVKLAPCFQPGVLVGNSLAVEVWQHLTDLFPLQDE
jgi:hypothetical protein